MGICGYDKPFEVEIQIVDHCNLNCNGCNHFSNIADKWYISGKEFKTCLDKIKKELVPHGLKRIMILGGEPFLHPQLKEFCEYAHNLFKEDNVFIDILTNGIKLNTLSDDEIQEYKKLAGIIVTSYPNFKEDKIKKNDLVLTQSRLFFVPNIVDDTGSQEVTDCRKQVLPCIFIRDYKVYMCPFAGTIHIYNKCFNKNIPITENDYISIYDLTFEKLQDFVNKHPHNICKYCSTSIPTYWTTHNYNEYNKIDLFKLFMNNYNEYNELINGSSVLKNLDKEFIDLVESQASSEQTVKRLNSRINGKLDIIIPYYKSTEAQFKTLYETLISQKDIDKYHIYLVSDNSPNEKEALSVFNPMDEKLNITHLKTSSRLGPGGAKQYGTDNSYNDYIFVLDSDDELIDQEGLNKAIALIEKEKCDILICKTRLVTREYPGSNKIKIIEKPNINTHGWFYSREFLTKNNISYKNYLIAEDADLTRQIYSKCPIVKNCDILLYQYNAISDNNIGTSTTPIDKLLWHNIVFLNGSEYLNNSLTDMWNLILTINRLEKNIRDFDKNEIKKLIAVGIGCVKLFYDNLPIVYKEQLSYPKEESGSIAAIIYNKIISNNLKFYLNNKCYKTIDDYKDLILNNIELSKNGKDLLLKAYEPYLKK